MRTFNLVVEVALRAFQDISIWNGFAESVGLFNFISRGVNSSPKWHLKMTEDE
jgi:hypothetical protein